MYFSPDIFSFMTSSRKKQILLLISVTFIFINVFSQEKTRINNLLIGIHSHYGFIIPHTSAIEPISHTKPYGFELDISDLHTNYDSWRVFHRYNISGIQAAYYNFQNPGVTGSAYALSIYTEPILMQRGKFLFSVKGGAGFSYMTKIFIYGKDTVNKFFSTRVSFPLYLSARLKYQVSPKLLISVAGTYNHISNGAMRLPNYGMNFPTFSAGLEYLPGGLPDLKNSYRIEKNKYIKNQYLLIQTLGGYKYVWGEPQWAYGISGRYVRSLRSFYSLNAGMELILDGGVRKMIEVHDKNLDYKRLALTGGQDFTLGRVVFTQYLGLYIYSPYKAKNLVYQKYEISAAVLPWLYAGFYLKAHTSDAELFGFMLNYRLRI
jgi:hypothetical protein